MLIYLGILIGELAACSLCKGISCGVSEGSSLDDSQNLKLLFKFFIFVGTLHVFSSKEHYMSAEQNRLSLAALGRVTQK